MDLSSDGKRVVLGVRNGKIRILNIGTMAEPRVLEGHTSPIDDVRFSPDEKFIASASRDETVKVWDAHSGTCLMVIKGGNDRVRSLAWRQSNLWRRAMR